MICAGNWKMNKSPAEARDFLGRLKSALTSEEVSKVVVLVPALSMDAAIETAKGTDIAVGGQNCHWRNSGAFTGENSPLVLREMGARYCLVGHSERRQLFAETDETVAHKVKACQSQSLIPIVCVGEQLHEREQHQTASVLTRQLQVGLSELTAGQPFWVAYEPVWAIGTGKVATPLQVREAHELIRHWLERHVPSQGDATILYGGSVKADNAAELKLPNVGGFLVGGASLEIESFLGILRA